MRGWSGLAVAALLWMAAPRAWAQDAGVPAPSDAGAAAAADSAVAGPVDGGQASPAAPTDGQATPATGATPPAGQGAGAVAPNAPPAQAAPPAQPASTTAPMPPAQAPAAPAPAASPAQAWDPESAPPSAPMQQLLPLRLAERPLTLPEGLVRLDATFAFTSQERPGALDRQSYVSFLGVVGVGVSDDVELGVIALPIQVSPDGHFNEPGGYALFRFLEGTVEVGLQVEARFPVREQSSFLTAASLRLLVHASDSVRIDGGASFAVAYDPTVTALRFPLSLTVQTSETFFVGVSTGFDVDDFDNAFIPVGVFLGGTLRREQGPSGDLRIGWFLPSVTDGTELWILGFGGNFYIY